MLTLWIKIEDHQDKYCRQYVLMNQKVDRKKVKEKIILDFLNIVYIFIIKTILFTFLREKIIFLFDSKV